MKIDGRAGATEAVPETREIFVTSPFCKISTHADTFIAEICASHYIISKIK